MLGTYIGASTVIWKIFQYDDTKSMMDEKLNILQNLS